MWASFVFLLIAAIFCVGYLQHRREMKELHAKAMQQFMETKAEASNPNWYFNGAEASIIEENVEWSRFEGTAHYFLTVYATNRAGEYFIFRTNYGRPILRHINHEVARAILKSKYRPPTPPLQRDAPPGAARP